MWQSPSPTDSSSPTQSCHGIRKPTIAPRDGQLCGDRPAALQRGHSFARLVYNAMSNRKLFIRMKSFCSCGFQRLHVNFCCPFPGLSGAMASISVRSGPPGSPTHPAQSLSRRRNGLHDVDLNTFIAEEMALHLDSTANRKRGPAPCSDVITDSPTHKRNRML